MSMHVRSLIVILCLIITGLWAVPIISAHEHNEDRYPAAPQEALADSSQIILDSLYGVINDGFHKMKPIFKRGCFDCHTDQTDYPWYHSIPGIKQLIDSDIKEGLEHINMSSGFPFVGRRDPAYQSIELERIKKEIKEGEMPILMYRMMHWSAAPSDEEAESIYKWVDSSLQMLTSHGFIKPEPAGENEDSND